MTVAETRAEVTPAEVFGHAAEVLLGENVRRLRAALGLSLRDLRERSDVAISLISRVEQGRGTSIRVAARLAGGLGVSLPALLSPCEGTDDYDTVIAALAAIGGDPSVPRQRRHAEERQLVDL